MTTDDRIQNLERENTELRALLAEVHETYERVWSAHLSERVEQALRRRGSPSTREDRARLALAHARWEIPEPAEFAIWVTVVGRYEVGPVAGMTPGEQLFNCAKEAGAIDGEWPTSLRQRAVFEGMAGELLVGLDP